MTRTKTEKETREDGIYTVTYEEVSAVKESTESSATSAIELILVDVVEDSSDRSRLASLIASTLSRKGYLTE